MLFYRVEPENARRLRRIRQGTSMQETPASIAAELLQREVVGAVILSWECFSVNGLKTALGLDATQGESVSQVSKEKSLLCIETNGHVVKVDMARTGRVVIVPKLERWRHVPGKRPPTARLLLADGRGLDFTEPAKTKRITFAVSEIA